MSTRVISAPVAATVSVRGSTLRATGGSSTVRVPSTTTDAARVTRARSLYTVTARTGASRASFGVVLAASANNAWSAMRGSYARPLGSGLCEELREADSCAEQVARLGGGH